MVKKLLSGATMTWRAVIGLGMPQVVVHSLASSIGIALAPMFDPHPRPLLSSRLQRWHPQHRLPGSLQGVYTLPLVVQSRFEEITLMQAQQFKGYAFAMDSITSREVGGTHLNSCKPHARLHCKARPAMPRLACKCLSSLCCTCGTLLCVCGPARQSGLFWRSGSCQTLCSTITTIIQLQAVP